MAKNLPVEAATASILSSKYELALEWLEHRWCVAWNQGLMRRSPLDQLQSIRPDLATRLQTVVSQLHGADYEPRASSSCWITSEQAAQKYCGLIKEYSALLAQVHTLPGFGDFLQPSRASTLVRAARYGPIVVVNCCMDRCDALLILPGQNDLKHIPLPNFTGEKLQLALDGIDNEIGLRSPISVVERRLQKDDQATTTAVLDAMEQHGWVHFACHAHRDAEDPLKSAFYLHDGPLDLAAINRLPFKRNRGLAFLSAAHTAAGSDQLFSEAANLASGMLMAGYTSVIGTMWSPMDDDAPLIADEVYARLMRDGRLGNGEAGKALHYAVAELREKVGEKAFARWAPYIHIGS
ncbi:hypothetical protein RSAG8_08619, partial [Rhizoctonia solani AG-8 WAC10335]